MRTRDENKEQAIYDKALEMIVNRGFDGLSMQKLAKAARVSPATIYIYFKDRDDLILKLYQKESQKMFDATLKDFDPSVPFDVGLKKQWINRAKYSLENPNGAHFMEQIKYSPHFDSFQRKTDPKFLTAMHEFVHNAIKRKELIKLSLEIYWAIAFAPLYALVRMHMSSRGFPGRDKFNLDEKAMNETLKLVLKALKP